MSTWDSIPDSAKDADGFWTGDYYGVLSFQVNKDIVKEAPADWADLLKPEFANTVALAGDPRASNQAIQGVYAAGLSSGACGPLLSLLALIASTSSPEPASGLSSLTVISGYFALKPAMTSP